MRILSVLTIMTSALAFSCSSNNQYYKADDLYNIRKIDAHAHMRTHEPYFIEQAKIHNFELMFILVDDKYTHEHIKEQFDYYAYHKNNSPEGIEFITSFSMENFHDEGWLDKTIEWINYSVDQGAVGVKVWKNIGMVEKDKDGSFIMIDDPRFDPIFKMLAQRGIPVLGHIGEPKNCWLPLDEMTTNNDRNYFTNNPEYHMYNAPDFLGYEEHIKALERMLEKNPDLKYIWAHLASLEWDVDEIAKRLDRFPNMAVDLAERMGQLFYQTGRDRERVRDFFIKYQDRILYGTDIIGSDVTSRETLLNGWNEIWLTDWLYFVTDEKLSSHLVNNDYRGILLPKDVVDKIYAGNAIKWYSAFK
jgi:predicted TIM-barrel fold metal-dependent hydrolase